MNNFYELYGLPLFSSYQDLKKKYHELVKIYHPDKVNAKKDHKNMELENCYLSVVEAWKIFKDPVLKEQYDTNLKQQKSQQQFLYFCNENVAIEDLYVDESYFYHDCRCGGKYYLDKDENEFPICIECDNCSLFIEVTNVSKVK